ncbi:MAG: polysaccharide deacetylase family protein [Piscirickettsiaceae bacterium]|nr:MAG: polysaccharide deacetylase family protein [Piscirickettsiaceae bacterium]
MTIDVEDYFQVSAFERHIQKSSWGTIPCRLENNMDRILQLLSDHETKATFFTLGWVADNYPQVVKKIVDEGHELASHGYQHIRVSDQTADEFLADISHTKKLLEDIAGKAVKGYRAASFSMGEKTPWAHDMLDKAGYKYSSSIYPIQHDHYGMPSASRFLYYPLEKDGKSLIEVPISTLDLVGKRLPVGGGGYFRFFPYQFSKWMIAKVNDEDNESTVFYFHPWEIDSEQPRQQGIPLKTKFRHYINLKHMFKRLDKLLTDFEWGTMDDVFIAGQQHVQK